MGILDNNSYVVDAVLTSKGRELLSKGHSEFKITKFALSDEGVDYTVYNPDHPSGSAYYGQEISAMPVIEPCTNETMLLRYKLVTLPKGTAKMPQVAVVPTSLDLRYAENATVTPNTRNAITGFSNQTYGYTCILSNDKVAKLETEVPAPNQNAVNTVPSWMDDSDLSKSVTAVGMKFKITAKDVTALSGTDRTATITIVGNETGGQSSLNVTVAPPTGSATTV